jgi:hypothetical protein
VAAEWRKQPGAVAFQGGGGAPVVGEGIDASYSWRRRWGMRGVRWRRAMMVEGGGEAHRRGQSEVAVAGSLLVASVCLRRSAMDRRQGERGEQSGARGMLPKEEERREKKRAGGIGDVFYQRGGRQGERGEGPGWSPHGR